ncbi:MAG TPA: hypothetical protein VGM03_17375 [Phycisphaerae bacterium]
MPSLQSAQGPWARHFMWDGARLVGKSAVGRATIHVLAMNDSLALAIRERLMAAGLFPAVARR